MRPGLSRAQHGMHTAVAEEMGNSDYTIELKQQDVLQYRLPRDKVNQTVTPVVISATAFYEGMRRTIKYSLTRLHMLKVTASSKCFNSRVDEISGTLASGCRVIAYMKLRAIILTEMPSSHTDNALRRPRDSDDLPIPTAFAFAIQQLGIVWDANAYQQAVEYARNLGMGFSVVDPKVKIGTAWWLFRQYFAEDVFELQCILPETNYNESMALALAHFLFLNGNKLNPTKEFIELNTIENAGNYDTMLRNPHLGIHLSSFIVLSDTAANV